MKIFSLNKIIKFLGNVFMVVFLKKYEVIMISKFKMVILGVDCLYISCLFLF